MSRGFKCLAIFLALLVSLHIVSLAQAETTEVTVSIVNPECSDGVDNDGDTFVDYPLDVDCEDEYDNQESGNALPQCNDTLDNDLDGNIDFPDDLGCDSSSDDSEAGEVTIDNTIQTTQTSGGGVPLTKDFDNSQTEVKFVGYAYPDSAISLINDGVEVARSETKNDGSFTIKKNGFKAAIHNLTLVAIDEDGRHSAPLSFSIFLNAKAITEIKDIFISPTLSLSHSEVKQGTKVLLRGKAQVGREVFVDQNNILSTNIIADARGNYNFSVDTENLNSGEYLYVSKIKNKLGQFIKSTLSKLVIGDKDIENKKEKEICVPKADLNSDCKVDIIDFSIAAFWWDTKLSDKISKIEKTELNNDGVIDIRDFSLLAFYWTG